MKYSTIHNNNAFSISSYPKKGSKVVGNVQSPNSTHKIIMLRNKC